MLRSLGLVILSVIRSSGQFGSVYGQGGKSVKSNSCHVIVV